MGELDDIARFNKQAKSFTRAFTDPEYRRKIRNEPAKVRYMQDGKLVEDKNIKTFGDVIDRLADGAVTSVKPNP